MPSHGPHITGEKKQYMIGDELNLNCTSGKSYPASILHWYINDEQMTERDGVIKYPNAVHAHGLVTTALGLSMNVKPYHFNKGVMKLRCVASLSPVVWQGHHVVHSNAPLLDNREASFLVRGYSEKVRGNIILAISICILVLIT
ncbi:uncharacterized protein LOC112126130 [Cimex lectularius]|uniref:CD80-like immunoglobulin C2-set domain-containing protein n=1 Tax=Cimex lectularius TaxID=79782 RepID=A0A8I6STZ8_CIMLE|nr:uncharacterized protein LOC112126130 [Cimex lectularius]